MPPIHAPPGDVDNFEDELVPNNIVGAYRVMEAARYWREKGRTRQ